MYMSIAYAVSIVMVQADFVWADFGFVYALFSAQQKSVNVCVMFCALLCVAGSVCVYSAVQCSTL